MPFSKFVLLFVVLLGLAAVAPQPVEAQVLYGSLLGTVVDSSEAVVPTAEVSIVSPETGQARRTQTNESGGYSFSNVLAGPYTLTVRAAGFQTFTQTNTVISINSVTRVNVQLSVGELAETITVEARAAALQTDQADVHMDLTQKEVADLPLPQYRNYQSLLNLVPGSTPSRFQNAITDSPDRALATNINGTNFSNNNTRVDGMMNVYVSMPHHVAYVPPAESIETVNVSTNAFDAEQGFAGGAAITVNTKSGTNQFHGSLFEYHNNSRLTARNFFFLEEKKPKNIINTYGGAAGGPIVTNKLFFFTSWEAVKERTNVSRFLTVPTGPERAGDFSSFGRAIYDPLTGNPNGSGRTRFANDTLPTARHSSVTRKMQDLIPDPNQTGTANNFFNSGTQFFNRDSLDVKINWTVSDKTTMFGKYSVFGALVKGQFSLNEAGGTCLCNGGSGEGDALTQVASLGATHVFSPTFLVDGTLGFQRVGQSVFGLGYGTNFGTDVLGIPGTNGPDTRQSGMPVFDISGYEPLGWADTWSPAFRGDNSWTYTTNFSKSIGPHDLRWGVDISKQAMNQWQPNIGGRGPRGKFDFDQAVTGQQGGGATSQFNAYASFLLGLPHDFGKALQFFAPSTTRQWLTGYYVRDRWQATNKLTVTLGVRYEYYPLPTRDHGGFERHDLDEDLVYVGGYGEVPRDAGWSTGKDLFAPRIGFAYRLGNKGVIRTGYGITIDPYPIGTAMKRAYPSVVAAEWLGANSFQPASPIENGIPFFDGPDFRQGVLQIPLDVTNRTMNKGLYDRGYIQSWNFIYEHELPGDLIGSIGYVATRSIRQSVVLEANAAAPGGGTAGRPLAQKFGRRVSTTLFTPFNTSNYNSLQASLNRTFRNGLLIKLSYTWSKAIDFNDNADSGLTWNYPTELARNRALAGFDVPHVFRFAHVYELPFGTGKRWAQSRVANALLGGWQTNGIFSAYSGRPFTVSASGASLNAPGNSQTADQVKPRVEKLGGIGRNDPYFDPTAFAPVTGVRFGSTGRNILRGPGAVHVDLSLFRSFKFNERWNLQFRAEAFNLANTPHFNNPSSNVSGGGFMGITSTAGEGTNADTSERRIRFGLKLTF